MKAMNRAAVMLAMLALCGCADKVVQVTNYPITVRIEVAPPAMAGSREVQERVNRIVEATLATPAPKAEVQQ